MKTTNTTLTKYLDSSETFLRKRDKAIDKRDRAIERLVVAWIKRHEENCSEDHEEELNHAADALVLAHVAMTFVVVH